ncbi:MAG: ferrochelatase [Acidimicrobiales bacterium]
MSGRVGVLMMAHGTPASIEEVEPFYTRIRRGSPPSQGQLQELVGRYQAIGGASPLAELTAAQVAGVRARLEASSFDRYKVAFGAKHTDPSIESSASALAKEVEGVVGVVLTPHRSDRGSREYLARAAAAIGAAAPGLAYVAVEQWFDAPGFAELLGARLNAAIDVCGGEPAVVFSAHSVPEPPDGQGQDPYGAQVALSGDLVAGVTGLAARGIPWQVAFQSAGRTDQRWLGPDLDATLETLAEQGTRSVVVCPIGFVSDHLEVLYDIDIEARATARSLGLHLSRTESLNADPELCALLAGVVQSAAKEIA